MPPLELNIKSRMLKTKFTITNGPSRTNSETGLKLKPQTLPEVLSNQVFLTLLLLLLNNKLIWLHRMLLMPKDKLITQLLLKPKRMELLPQELIKFKVVPRPLKTQEDGDSSGQPALFLKQKDLQKTLIKLKNKLSKMLLRLLKFKLNKKDKMFQQLPQIMLVLPQNLQNIQPIPSKKLTMLEEEEFMLLEMLLDGECKWVLETLLEMQVTSHTFLNLLDQTSSIKQTTNPQPSGENFKIFDSVKYYIWLSI